MSSANNKMNSEVNYDDLTIRQRNLLFAVIKEYCELGDGVSSKDIKEKYNFQISPATVRNEFVALRKLGYLYQPFTNSSSQPTDKAFKLFINSLIVGLQNTNQQQKYLRQKILELQDRQSNMQKEISRLLADQTQGIGFSVNDSNENVVGVKNLLKNPDLDEITDLLDFLDNFDKHKHHLLEHKQEIIHSEISEISENLEGEKTDQTAEYNLQTIFGSDSPVLPLGKGYALVATKVNLDNQKTVIGLITPTYLLAREQNIKFIDSLSKVLNSQKNQLDSDKKHKSNNSDLSE